MKILTAKHAGFCHGVSRAIDIVNTLTGEVHSIGHIIHNKKVVDELAEKGVKVVDSHDKIKSGKVILSAHGHPKHLQEELKKKEIEIIDTTCQNVKAVQNIVEKFCKDGYKIIILGDKNHKEVDSIQSYCKNAIVVENEDDVDKIENMDKVCLVTQTTQSFEKFLKIVDKLKNKVDNLKVFNTICDATKQRQESAIELARKVDVMIVVGDETSANTKRLYELCSKIVDTMLIESKDDLDWELFSGKETVGVTAGASTPQWIVDEVVEELRKY